MPVVAFIGVPLSTMGSYNLCICVNLSQFAIGLSSRLAPIKPPPLPD